MYVCFTCVWESWLYLLLKCIIAWNMYINEIISDSSKYHQENKIGGVLEGNCEEAGKMWTLMVCWESPCWGVKLELRLWWIKEGRVFQAEGIACANVLRQRFTVRFKKQIAVNKEVNGRLFKWLNRVWLFVTLWNVACQVPMSKGFSRLEYWSRLPFPPPGDLPDSGIKPTSLMSLALQPSSLPLFEVFWALLRI